MSISEESAIVFPIKQFLAESLLLGGRDQERVDRLLVGRAGSQALASGRQFLKRGWVFHRPQEEEGETAGEAPRGPHRAATERTSPVSFLSYLSGSWESLLPEPSHPY